MLEEGMRTDEDLHAVGCQICVLPLRVTSASGVSAGKALVVSQSVLALLPRLVLVKK
jgi:hypothetical protein